MGKGEGGGIPTEREPEAATCLPCLPPVLSVAVCVCRRAGSMGWAACKAKTKNGERRGERFLFTPSREMDVCRGRHRAKWKSRGEGVTRQRGQVKLLRRPARQAHGEE